MAISLYTLTDSRTAGEKFFGSPEFFVSVFVRYIGRSVSVFFLLPCL